MNCEDVRERLIDVAAGADQATGEENQHMLGCVACAGRIAEMRKTMALLDEWQAPEPSPYFDVRLRARLREEIAKPQAGWLQWFRRPVLAAALSILMAVGAGLFFARSGGFYGSQPNNAISDNFGVVEPGTAVSDLQSLDTNHELYSDFELLDDLDVQQDVTANP